MMKGLFAVALSAFTVSGIVIDSPKTYQEDWIQLVPTNQHHEIELMFLIKQQNVERLEQKLFEISTPYTDEYGHWLTLEEMNEMIAPKEESINKVKEWILSSDDSITSDDIESVTLNGDILKWKTTIGKANLLLNCKYYDYLYDNSKMNTKYSETYDRYIITRLDKNCDYDVPSDVAKHLDYITPTKRLPKVPDYKNVKELKQVGADEVTPAVLKSLYKVGDAVGKASGNSEGIASFVRQYFSTKDLSTFWTDYDIQPDTVTKTDSADGDGDGLEALLDTQYISSIGELVPLQVWYNSGTFADAMVNWLTNVQASSTAPLLFSVSYGQPETDWGYSEVERLNTEFLKTTSLGITIFFASGDSGAGGGCNFDEPFEPEFPASCPYLTSVGGVQGGDANSNPIGERMWVDGGGGFSNVAGTQSWQSVAVANYFKEARKLPDSSQYNATGRGYPDISAQSVDFIIVSSFGKEAVDGTSCASPTAAGVFALLNDLRLQNSMSQLGYLNPFIYRIASNDSTAFNDVTSGYNKGCSALAQGFYAEAGWDPASGWGSPNYEVLSKYVLQTGEITKKWVKDTEKSFN